MKYKKKKKLSGLKGFLLTAKLGDQSDQASSVKGKNPIKVMSD